MILCQTTLRHHPPLLHYSPIASPLRNVEEESAGMLTVRIRREAPRRLILLIVEFPLRDNKKEFSARRERGCIWTFVLL